MEMIKLERSIEVEREYLADKSDIEVDRVFLTVAQSLVDKPTASQIYKRGRHIGFNSLQDAELIVKRFDADEDGCLTYWEFANLLLPQDPLRSRNMLKRPDFISTQERSLAALRLMISKLIEVEKKCQ
jgi:hypothetical protein